MQNVRRRPLSRRKCNYLRVHEIQNKSLLTVTTTPPFCATIPPVRSSSDTNYFMRQSGAHSLCSPLSSSAARKFTTSKALPFPVPSIVYNQASPPTACTNHRQPTGLLSCFFALFRLIHHFRLLLRNQVQFRRLEGARLRHRVFRTVQAVQNQIAEERVK